MHSDAPRASVSPSWPTWLLPPSSLQVRPQCCPWRMLFLRRHASNLPIKASLSCLHVNYFLRSLNRGTSRISVFMEQLVSHFLTALRASSLCIYYPSYWTKGFSRTQSCLTLRGRTPSVGPCTLCIRYS